MREAESMMPSPGGRASEEEEEEEEGKTRWPW
jgi:hypothetical protein